MRSFFQPWAMTALAGFAAGQIHVPGDYADPQTAVDHAAPGDVIVVHGGTWTSAGPGPALLIDKALTLIGAPAPTFAPPERGFFRQPPAIELAGPGAGTVVLANVITGGATNGFDWSAQSGGLVGGGFAEVHLYDSTFVAPAWFALTGVAEGSSAIAVDVSFLLLSGVTARASHGGADACYGFALDGHAGVRSTGTVVVLDSLVRGGTFIGACFNAPGCEPLWGGTGGSGIAAARVDAAGSDVAGAAGAAFTGLFGMPCGRSPDGRAALTATHVSLANDLAVTRPARIGGSITLSWSSPGPMLQLYYSLAPSAPRTHRARLSELYLDPAHTRLLGVFRTRGGTGSTQVPLPALPSLVGLELCFQGIDRPRHVTRPVSVVLLP